jgi:glutathione synthase/RimK-type ligase-like ATP-grasp enzyme
MAQYVGLSIPKTLMSNDPIEIRSFWKRNEGKCIYKPFTPPSWQLAETRILSEEDLSHLDKLRHAPIIVQEKIEKALDIRVNIFGETVFSSAITTNHSFADLDWRIDLSAIWKEYTLPDEVSQQLIHLLRILGLHYGCIDLRQQPDGTYVFLEVNPGGQFVFIEIDTGQPLIRSFAELLLNPYSKDMKRVMF